MRYNKHMDLHDKSLKMTAKQIETLNALGLYDTDSVLSYYPFRYETLNVIPYEEWKIKDKVTLEAEVVSGAKMFRHGRISSTRFEVMAYDRVFKVTIFNRPWASRLKMNEHITISGIYMGNDRITATTYDTKPLAQHDSVKPVYSIKTGMRQTSVVKCIQKVYDGLANEIQDIIPEPFIRKYRLLRRSVALRKIHFPDTLQDVKDATRTLKYEEFLKFFTAVQLMKNQNSLGTYKTPRRIDMRKVKKMIDALPYPLTKDQDSALQDVFRDMTQDHMMYRLIQGDVGCGKTTVAAAALYGCVLAGYQGALLAPTEILARQHMESLEKTLSNTGVHTAVLYSGLSEKEKRDVIEKTQSGEIDILIGTHAILEDAIVFHNLGLVVADEQQRFGVEQRRKLRLKGEETDFLLMSATPIPRTLASTLFGDMDISTIETMPPGRKTPVTQYIQENSFRSVLDDVKALLDEGRQLYVICAAVEKNEEYHARNVNDVTVSLTMLFPEYKVGTLHGRMSSMEKQNVMQAFYDNQIQILVSTTVVEVGMNVVNATGMIIYDADRFGLSQLHQLRGRIQRGSKRGYCWLLSGSKEEKAAERLNVLVKSNNGFEISYEDLRLRGPGDILGTRQSGLPDFILGNVVDDTNIINTARKDAADITADPGNPDYAAILDICSVRGASYTD